MEAILDGNEIKKQQRATPGGIKTHVDKIPVCSCSAWIFAKKSCVKNLFRGVFILVGIFSAFIEPHSHCKILFPYPKPRLDIYRALRYLYSL